MKERQNISRFKTIIKLRGDKKLYKMYFKKTIASAQEKLDKEEAKLYIKTKTIANSIIEIFDLPLESLIHCNFFKKILQHKFGKRSIKLSKVLKVLYHTCDACYFNGTLPLITKERGCSRATEYPKV